ncbi:hypothetical protein N9973_00355 [bacterium]|nr:hypothetical protein [bacterium]
MNLSNLIKESLDFSLSNSNPFLLNRFSNFALPNNCVLIEVKDDSIYLIKSEDSNHTVRLNGFVGILKDCIAGKNFHFKFILNLSDHEVFSDFPVFTFSKYSGSNHILVPDPHYCISYRNYKPIDSTDFSEKKRAVVFRGADTGSYPIASCNERINICDRLSSEKDFDLKISKFDNYCKSSLDHFGFNFDDISGDFLSREDQSAFKYIADIYGHTVAWDRNLWAMGLNSILLKIHFGSKKIFHLWYSNFLDDHNIVPNFDVDSLLEFFRNDDIERDKKILEKQKQFSAILNDDFTHVTFFSLLLEKYNQLYNGPKN